jgi:hypothetical protein
MTSLFERLDQEEAVVRGELAALREKIAVADERLAHLTITRETLLSLVVEEYADQGDNVMQEPPEATADEPVANDPAPDSQPADAEGIPVGPCLPARWSGKRLASGCWCCWRVLVGR